MEVYRPPVYTRFTRPLLRVVFRGIFHLLSEVVITGREHVPTEGAYIMAINHISLYEAPLVVAFWPQAPEVAGAADVWNRPGQSLLARAYGGLPIHRGEYDRRVIELILSALRSGYPLLLAPEGTRSHQPEMRQAKPGIAYLMDKAQVPVVPVGVVGTTEDLVHRALRLQRPKLEINIGAPLNLPPVEGRGRARREARQENADRVMAHIAALLPPDYRGHYAGQAEQILDSGL
jgi:1-acyl-sn-glycerol-3-phosphate acyltransferase